jgi:trimethylamine:corrinoid methyltransferase-like protein
MIDRTNWDQWKGEGQKTFRDRALEVIADCLSNYEVEPLDDELHREIREMFARTALDKDVRLPSFN